MNWFNREHIENLKSNALMFSQIAAGVGAGLFSGFGGGLTGVEASFAAFGIASVTSFVSRPFFKPVVNYVVNKVADFKQTNYYRDKIKSWKEDSDIGLVKLNDKENDRIKLHVTEKSDRYERGFVVSFTDKENPNRSIEVDFETGLGGFGRIYSKDEDSLYLSFINKATIVQVSCKDKDESGFVITTPIEKLTIRNEDDKKRFEHLIDEAKHFQFDSMVQEAAIPSSFVIPHEYMNQCSIDKENKSISLNAYPIAENRVLYGIDTIEYDDNKNAIVRFRPSMAYRHGEALNEWINDPVRKTFTNSFDMQRFSVYSASSEPKIDWEATKTDMRNQDLASDMERLQTVNELGGTKWKSKDYNKEMYLHLSLNNDSCSVVVPVVSLLCTDGSATAFVVPDKGMPLMLEAKDNSFTQEIHGLKELDNMLSVNPSFVDKLPVLETVVSKDNLRYRTDDFGKDLLIFAGLGKKNECCLKCENMKRLENGDFKVSYKPFQFVSATALNDTGKVSMLITSIQSLQNLCEANRNSANLTKNQRLLDFYKNRNQSRSNDVNLSM